MKKLMLILIATVTLSCAPMQEAKPITPRQIICYGWNLTKRGFKNIAFYIAKMLGCTNKKKLIKSYELDEYSKDVIYVVSPEGKLNAFRMKKYKPEREEEMEEDK